MPGSGASSHIALPTGFPCLDRALSIGGFPRGRIVEVFGPAASGKTALALSCVAHLQRQGATAAWVDAEHSFSPAFAVQLGIELATLPVVKPASAEDAFAMARQFLLSGAVDLVVIDSAAALTPQLELVAGLERQPRGLQNRVLSSELRRLSRAAARAGACALFLNQLRLHLAGPSAGSETSAGGPSLKLYAAVRIALAARGGRVCFRVLKNKCGAAFTAGELGGNWASTRPSG